MDGLRLGDESYKVFFNATGHKGEITDELRALMDYFMDPENVPEGEKTQLVEELDDFVEFANRDADWRRNFVTYEQAMMDQRNDGIEEDIAIGEAIGEAKGEVKGRVEGFLKAIVELARDGLLPIAEACRRANLTENELRSLIAAGN